MPKTRSLIIAPYTSHGDLIADTARRALTEIGIEVLSFEDVPAGTSFAAAVIDAIRVSDFVVVDVTGQNPNVFYELGVAHAWRKPTILLVMSEPGQHISAALVGFPHIVYDANDLHDLAKHLKRAASVYIEKQVAVA